MTERLKSLELQGYKTFASRTDFIFSDHITAIVGPNGSGKSNIADAIRWVLGEQTYSLLRGKRTEDMIFAGSEQRPRAGMASVSIVFDNSDGWLPIDFSEVAITRRAYRDGENEYLVNSQRVRLRDVSELLAQSGLAERTYTVIGQGLVDAALALKAEERRRLFEEAAGIGLHRARREETLKRLDNTSRNLERVEDILTELQPRLRSLERQARRAQEYEQVKSDLQILLRDWYGYHWHRAQSELAAAQQATARQERHLSKARQAQAELGTQIDQLRAQLQEARDKLNNWHRELSGLHLESEKVGRTIAVGEERKRSLTEQSQLAQDELARLEDEAEYAAERLENTQDERQQTQIEYDEAVMQLESAEHDLEARRKERNLAEQAVQDSRQQLTNHIARQEYLAKRLAEMQAHHERQQSEIRGATANVNQGELELKKSLENMKSSSQNYASAQSQREKAAGALDEQRGKLVEVESRFKQGTSQLSGIQTQIARLQAESDVLEKAEKNLIGYATGARILLQAVQKSRLKAPLGALSSQIEVPAAYEKAILAALGEYVDGVLFPEVQDAEEAFEELDQKAARGVLLPQESFPVTPEGVGDAPDLPGVVGWAAELVDTKEELRPLIVGLLGRILIVQDRPAARRVLRALHQDKLPGCRVITMSGDVFFMEGPMLIGPINQPGSFERPRQLREIKANLSEAEAELVTVRKLVDGLTGEKERLATEEAKQRKALELAEQAERTAYEKLGSDDLAVNKARQSLTLLKDQLARLQKDLAQDEQEIRDINQESRKIAEEIRGCKEKLRENNEILFGLSLDDLLSRQVHWSTRRAVHELAVKEAQIRLDEKQTELDRQEQLRVDTNLRLQSIQANMSQLSSDIQAALQTETTLTVKVTALQDMISPVEGEIESLEKEHNILLKKESGARQNLSQAEHIHAQARITQARRQEILDSLRNRIEDDFGLVAFRYAESISGPTPLPLDGMVEQLPVIHEIPPELEENVKRQRAQLRRIGPVNQEAHQEYLQVKERFEFLTDQITDLHKAEEDLNQVISELDLLMEREFRRTFDAVAHEFRQVFTRLFGGGSARLVMTSPEDVTETGIDIEARLPGRREQGLSLLSGGERSLTATALVFALLKVSPTPFCVLDEVDAMLDEVNVGRFRELLTELSGNTQFVIITHNRNTVQAAEVIYGVTMGHDSTSQVISLKLDEVSRIVE